MNGQDSSTDETIDIAIVGGGPAGLTAALYASRARSKTVVFEKAMPGGQIVTTDHIENYPGFHEGLSGAEVGMLMHQHAEKYGAEFRTFEEVEEIRPEDMHFIVTVDGEDIPVRTVILCTGAVPAKLGIPGEAEYTGRGVSWCATCDGALYRDKTVAVIGGGDAAIEEAIFLTKFAAKVYVVHRRDELRATKCIQERCFANDRIEVLWSRVVREIEGDDTKVTGIVLDSTKGEDAISVPVDGVFEFVGVIPHSELVQDLVDLDERGFVKIDHRGLTSLPGLYAAGDVTDYPLKQVVTAAGQGATAADDAVKHIDSGVCTI
jgi:thioredoxin reductase (NADPH)